MRLPSYIAPRAFALALVDTLAPDIPATADDGRPRAEEDVIKTLRERIEGLNMPDSVKHQILLILDDARGEIDRFRLGLERLFDDTSDDARRLAASLRVYLDEAQARAARPNASACTRTRSRTGSAPPTSSSATRSPSASPSCSSGCGSRARSAASELSLQSQVQPRLISRVKFRASG